MPAHDEDRYQPDHRDAADGGRGDLEALVTEDAGDRQRRKRDEEAVSLPPPAVRSSFPERELTDLPGVGLIGLRHPQDPFRGAGKHVVVSAHGFRWRQRPGNPPFFVQNLGRQEAGSPFGPIRRCGSAARGRARPLP